MEVSPLSDFPGEGLRRLAERRRQRKRRRLRRGAFHVDLGQKRGAQPAAAGRFGRSRERRREDEGPD